jgi:hypothetical protein
MCSDALDRNDGIRKELTAGVTHAHYPIGLNCCDRASSSARSIKHSVRPSPISSAIVRASFDFIGVPGRIRTCDLRIRNPLLLSS